MNQTKTLRKAEGDIYVRGAKGMHYVHKRIPAAVRTAYPRQKTHITVSLNTSDIQEARRCAPLWITRIKDEFERKKAEIDLQRVNEQPVRVTSLTDRQLKGVMDHWFWQVLLADDLRRRDELDDDEFSDLVKELTEQREIFGQMTARGRFGEVAGALGLYLRLCGIVYEPSEEERRHSAGEFVTQIVRFLDVQLERLQGKIVKTDVIAPAVVHPLYLIAPERAPRCLGLATWDMVFDCWQDEVEARPTPTIVANNTAWQDLRRFALANKAFIPSEVSKELVTAFGKYMKERLAVDTINNRLTMIRNIYAVAVEEGLLKDNPAENFRRKRDSTVNRRRKKRLPFTSQDLVKVFSSQVYQKHRRSSGDAGEGTYWIPLIMFYTGARPEEVAGLALADLKHDQESGWYIDIVDRFEDDDDLFDDETGVGIPKSHLRTLKTGASIRKIPVCQQLLNLGLLRYVEFVRNSGSSVFFPTLTRDHVGKLCGAFVKVFGRIKRKELGLTDKRKVLYSFRHTMKNLLLSTDMPALYLRRILGHVSGLGATTDGYGSDLPLSLVASYFSKVTFPQIPALPWEPGRGPLRFPKRKQGEESVTN